MDGLAQWAHKDQKEIREIRANVETTDFQDGPVIKENRGYKEKREIREIPDNKENPDPKDHRVFKV
jgi:hypothetical protein